jgi:hypothetical protein
MTTTLTLGDVAIELLILFGGTFCLWLLRKWQIRFSDYWARRSTSSRQERIVSLENALAKYEADFLESRTFIGRILVISVTAIFQFSISCLSVGLGIVLAVISTLNCDLHPDCVPQHIWIRLFHSSWRAWNLSIDQGSLLLMLVGVFSTSICILLFQELLLEIYPEKFRAKVADRISRLRARITPEG